MIQLHELAQASSEIIENECSRGFCSLGEYTQIIRSFMSLRQNILGPW